MFWFWNNKGKELTPDERIASIVKGQEFKKVPRDINQWDESYRALIRELAKR